ncbi:MAG: hypothetical protein WC467_00590 [Patescibacteria group bacterium]
MSNWFKKLFGGSDHGSCEHCGHCDHCEEKDEVKEAKNEEMQITSAPELKAENMAAEDITKNQ